MKRTHALASLPGLAARHAAQALLALAFLWGAFSPHAHAEVPPPQHQRLGPLGGMIETARQQRQAAAAQKLAEAASQQERVAGVLLRLDQVRRLWREPTGQQALEDALKAVAQAQGRKVEEVRTAVENQVRSVQADVLASPTERYEMLKLTRDFAAAAIVAGEEARAAETRMKAEMAHAAGQKEPDAREEMTRRAAYERSRAVAFFQREGDTHRALLRKPEALAAYRTAVRLLEGERGSAAWLGAQARVLEAAASLGGGDELQQTCVEMVEALLQAPPLPPEQRPGKEEMERIVRHHAALLVHACRDSGANLQVITAPGQMEAWHLRSCAQACYVHAAFARRFGWSVPQMKAAFASELALHENPQDGQLEPHMQGVCLDLYQQVADGSFTQLSGAFMDAVNAVVGRLQFGPAQVTVMAVVSGSPAARAGLQQGDVILRYQDMPVPGMHTFARLTDELWQQDRDAVATLQVRRDGPGAASSTLTFQVPAGKLGIVLVNRPLPPTPEEIAASEAARPPKPAWTVKAINTSTPSTYSLPEPLPVIELGKGMGK